MLVNTAFVHYRHFARGGDLSGEHPIDAPAWGAWCKTLNLFNDPSYQSVMAEPRSYGLTLRVGF